MKKNVYIQNKRADIKAIYDTQTEEVTILKGSKIVNFATRNLGDSLTTSYIKKIDEIKNNTKIIQDNTFVQDYTFSSLSAAASIIEGSSRNGKETFILEDTNKPISSILDKNNNLIEYIYENIDEYDDIIKISEIETEEFCKSYPLEKLKNLKLEEYDKIGNKTSFMNMIENKTNAYASGNLNSNHNKIFEHRGGENYYIKDKLLNNVENINLTEEEIFRKYITKCYEYVKNFNKETYNSLKDYVGKEYLDGSNVIKMKLILNYLGPVITGITSVNIAKDIANFLNINYNPKEDSVDLNIKITNYIYEKSPELKEYSLIIITAILKQYYKSYIKSKIKYYIGGATIDEQNRKEEFFKNNVFAIGWEGVGNLNNYKNQEQIFKKVLEISKSEKELKNFKKVLNKLQEANKGDRIILKSSYTANKHQDSAIKVFAIGEILKHYKEGYKFIPGLGHTIEVNWEQLEEPKEIICSYRKALEIIDEQKFRELEKEIIESNYNKEIYIGEIENSFCGFNKIYYGAPGCGKSYKAKEEAESEIYYQYERILFHPEYTYSDFIGQLQPVLIRNDETKKDEITYKFVPGPFTKILKEAINHPERNYCLLIEEINRGNTSAIFGDILQLLDRKEGKSEYPIKNELITNYLKEKTKEEKIEEENFETKNYEEISIPKNLSIIATMNSSDQNVFALDTAFKRRWLFKRMPNDFKKHNYKTTQIAGTNTTWEKFATTINNIIINPEGINDEDKQIGQYFVSENELQNKEVFAEKVLFYLWSDVVRFDKSLLFDIKNYKTLDSIIQGFIEKGLAVFSKEIFDGENIDNEE